ncbi:MAG: HNH endonuclease, partial [Thermomicrobiales bacterium]
GQLYDSKAILGVAHKYVARGGQPLQSSEFSGGVETVVTRLRSLGFEVVSSSQVEASNRIPGNGHVSVAVPGSTPSPGGHWTYLLTWNPSQWDWSDLPQVVERLHAGHADEFRWSSGNTKTIVPGSRVFMLKQGKLPRGLMASGWTTGPVEQDEHWDSERAKRHESANYVPLRIDVMLDPAKDELLRPEEFPPGAAADVYWHPAASGTSMPTEAARQLEQLWAAHVGEIYPPPDDDELSAFEGEARSRMIMHRKRERALREAKIQSAISSGTLHCEVTGCGFEFWMRYGELGRGYAQVHHLTPLSSHDGQVKTHLSDLAIVCANCHAMIHRGGMCRELATLIPRDAE